MKLYHFINVNYGLAAIRDQRVKLSTYDDLNDPFELYAATLNDRDIRETFYQIKNDLTRTMALLCCSKSWRNSLLWSHYADRHKGLALELEVENRLVTHIEYRKSRIRVDHAMMDAQLQKSPGKALGSRIMATKSSDWAYEEEARVQFDIRHLDQSKKPFFVPFDQKIQLVGVILGPLCSLTSKDIQANLPSGSSLLLRKARMAFRTFEVVNKRDFKPIKLSN